MTTTTTRSTMTADDVLAAVEHLEPLIASRAPEIEAARRLPADLLTTLHDSGAFRVLRPVSHGGVGGSLVDTVRVAERLAMGDASTAWTVMIAGTSWVDLLGLPRDVFDAIWDGSPDVAIAGVFAPSGSITPITDGYEVTGRWALASGCEDADWLYTNCVEGFTDDGPQLRIALLEPGQVTIEDTWHVSGLRGTGSHHVSVVGAVVPIERTTVPLHDPPCIDEPIARIPTPTVVGFPIAGVALGVAAGALREITRVAAEKVPLLAAGALTTNPLFQYELARAQTQLRAARSLVLDTVEEVWATALAADQFTLDLRARARAANAHAVEVAASAIATAHRFAGSTSLYDDSPLPRQLRDIHAITQHFIVKPDTFTVCGIAALGGDIATPVF